VRNPLSEEMYLLNIRESSVENGLINVENVESPLREDLLLENIRAFTLEKDLMDVANVESPSCKQVPLWYS
jgi:hypothetical protein